MTAKSIDEVIDQLDHIISECLRENSRLGYFPALYRQVTIRVKDDIRQGLFEDGQRMAELDVRFANRYFAAYWNYRRGNPITRSWHFAFNCAGEWWPIVLQHLLLGMNAHINLDLGIAAAQTAPGNRIHSLEKDFMQINAILASLIDDIQRRLTNIWPLLAVLDSLAGKMDEALARFSLDKAREQAWKTALNLATLPQDQLPQEIVQLDRNVADFAKIVHFPGPLFAFAFKLVRLGEWRTVPQIIRLLS